MGLGQQDPGLPPADSDMPFLNAEEAWDIYDTIQIRDDVEGKEGYASYVALGAVPIWPFFDQRKADIGIAYTNRDSNESLEFAYECYSIGVRFIAPEGKVEQQVGALGPDNVYVHSIFSRMIAEHVGLRFKLRQDDKLIHTCTLAPEGVGPNGISAVLLGGVAPVNDFGSYSNTNGEPHISGRWKFPEPVEMPRGATFNVRLEPSDYCRRLLSAMIGPTAYTLSITSGEEVTKPACSLIRVDMIGKRGVQQRNALHY